MAEFIKWESTARLFRDVVITEKLDGTNACVIFERVDVEDLPHTGPHGTPDLPNRALRLLDDGGITYAVYAQSRNRMITPSSDNAGFAKWVEQNYQQIFHVLGEGRHYGEWWGQGIGRKYDMTEKVFSVFNTAAWFSENMDSTLTRAQRATQVEANIDVVPVLFQGAFSEEIVRDYANQLRLHGSYATSRYTGENFMRPEGICIYHKAADTIFKYTLDSNDKHKWELEAPTVNHGFLGKLLRRK